jgi:hypothetical protein
MIDMFERYKRIITPPYTRKDAPALIITLLIVLFIPLTLIFLNEKSFTRSDASIASSLEPENGTVTGKVAIRTNDPQASGGYIALGQQCTTSSTTWQNAPITPQSDTFTITYDATPNGNNIDAVTGLSNGPADNHADLAVITRFNPNGMIDARNGSNYNAASQIPYASGKTYTFRLVVDIPNHRYTIYVTPQGEQEITVGTDYAFRTEQGSVTTLSNIAMYGQVGNHTTCFSDVTLPQVACQDSSLTWQNTTIANQTGTFTATFDATPNGANIDAVTGLSNGPASSHDNLAAIVRFNPNGNIDARNGNNYTAAATIPYTQGTKYTFRLVVDVPNHRYTAYVKPEGGQEVVVGANYPFRTEQASVTALNNIANYGQVGTHNSCTPTISSVTAAPTSAATPTSVVPTSPLVTATKAPSPTGSTDPTTYGPQGTPVACTSLPHTRQVPVSTRTALQTAVNNAQPGDLIILAPGTYTGQYLQIYGKSGTATNPITLCGTKSSTVEATGQSGNTHAIWFQNSNHWRLYNFNVRKGNFSIFVEWSDNVSLEYLDVGFSGLALIHTWKDSNNFKVKNSVLHDAGIMDSEVGEGMYLGSNNWWWDDPGFQSPDRNDNFEFVNNKCYNITAECVDIKEGVTGGLVKGNYFDGAGMIGQNAPESWSPDGVTSDWYVDSWVDIKGNNILITENYGDWLPYAKTNGATTGLSESDGFEVTGSITGWGRNNTFSKNYGNGRTITNYRSGYTRPAEPSRNGVWYTDSVLNAGNVTKCDNTFVNFRSPTRGSCTP